MENGIVVAPVPVREPDVVRLVEALTVDLAGGGYTPEETFGYSVEQLASSGVHLVGARVGGRLVGIGGLELQAGATAELKRFYVEPGHRGSGVADAVMGSLLAYGREHGVRVLRLETGDRQHVAVAFYRRHGFVEVPRFPPYLASETSVCMQRDL